MASGTPTLCTWAPGDFRIMKHIPKSARGACALHLASILRSVVSDAASVSNWQALFHWAASILQPAKRGGKRHNLSSTVKKRISSFSVRVTPAKNTDNSHNRRASTNNTLSQAIAAKLEDGNVMAAIRLLISDDTVAAPSVESLAKLKEKHPDASLQATALPTSQQSRCLSVEESEVRRAVLTFPAGSAGGPGGLRPQHNGRNVTSCLIARYKYSY